MAANLKGKQTNSFSILLKLTSSYNRRFPRDSLTGSARAAASCRSTPPSHPLARTWFQVVSLLRLSRLLEADFRSESSLLTICCTYPARLSQLYIKIFLWPMETPMRTTDGKGLTILSTGTYTLHSYLIHSQTFTPSWWTPQ